MTSVKRKAVLFKTDVDFFGGSYKNDSFADLNFCPFADILKKNVIKPRLACNRKKFLL